MRFTDLLENYIILKDNDKELYYDIKDNINDYMNMIKEYLSYKLIIKDNFIKLEKVPANPQGFMGIKEFDSIKEYVFFMILLIFLEDKNNEEQFILSNLTEYIKQNYSEEKIDWTKQKNRRCLINVIKFAINIGIIKRNDGDEELYSKDETRDVLYESTGISRYILRSFDNELDNANSYKDLLNEENTKYNVYRNLLLNPVVYNKIGVEHEYDYIVRNKNEIKDVFEENLEWDIHLYKNAIIPIITNNEVKDVFPNKKGESAAVLFINKEVRRNINSGNLKKEDNDTVVMSNSEFDEFIIEVRRTHGHGFTKTLRDVSEQVFINIIRNFMKDFSMIREEKDFTILMPIIGKVLGEYPEDYKGEAKDE